MKKNKTILAIWNSGGKGKSSSVRGFADALKSTYLPPVRVDVFQNPNPFVNGQDFRYVVDINGVRIGIESQGDPNTNLRSRLDELSGGLYDCDIIVCSTRTRGETIDAVWHVVRKGYEPIWTSTYDVRDAVNHNLVNTLKGKHLLELLVTLGLI